MKSKKRISSITILKVICMITLLMFPMMSFWGNYMAKSLHYDDIIDNFEFGYVLAVEKDVEYPFLYHSSSWEFSKKLYETDEQIETLSDLEKNAENVALVTMKDYEVSGEGLLAKFVVEEVIKSKIIKKQDTIQIYDMVYSIDKQEEMIEDVERVRVKVNYVSGNLPLKKDEKYLVFFEKAINPADKNTYMYSSLRYGNFRIDENPIIQDNFDIWENQEIADSKGLKEIIQYDMLYFPSEEIDAKELKLYKEAYEKFKEYATN